MYFTDNGFVISGQEIIIIAVTILAIFVLLNLVSMRINNIARKINMSDDYPGSTKFQDKGNKSDTKPLSDIADTYIADVHLENEFDTKRREKVIFEENISNVSFRYDEKTKILAIREGYDSSDAPTIKVKLDSLDDLRTFVDRLEEYVNE